MPHGPRLATLILLTMLTTLSLNMFLPALPDMARDFDVPYGVISLSVGGYLAATAVLSLLMGPLSDRIGRRPVALGMLAIFTLASAGAAMAQNITVFLACRLGQGVMVGGFILASAIVRDTREDTEVARLLAYITSAMAIAPLLGPILGGLVLTALDWRAIFWIYAAFGAGLLLIATKDLRETRKRQTTGPSSGIANLLRRPRFLSLVGMVALSTSCFYAFLAGTPLVAAAAFGFAGPEVGVALGSITGGFMVGSFAAGRLTRRHGPQKLMLAGRYATLGGLTGGLLLTLLLPGEPLALFGATLFIGIGNGLSIPSGNALILSLNPDRAGTASGITGASTVGTGALLTTLAAAALQNTPTAFALVLLLWVLSILALICALLARR